jgi:hypothetical protein
MIGPAAGRGQLINHCVMLPVKAKEVIITFQRH